MPFRLLAKTPVDTSRLDMSGTNVTTAAWVTVTASLAKACTGFEVFNPSGTTMQIATGAVASEVALPYTLLPGGSTGVIPCEINRLTRISVKAVDATADSGLLVFNYFG